MNKKKFYKLLKKFKAIHKQGQFLRNKNSKEADLMYKAINTIENNMHYKNKRYYLYAARTFKKTKEIDNFINFFKVTFRGIEIQIIEMISKESPELGNLMNINNDNREFGRLIKCINVFCNNETIDDISQDKAIEISVDVLLYMYDD